MAKVIDTRVDGRGLKYTAYDTKLVDYAKAPKTGIDPDKKFKIGKPKTLEKPGEVTYFGEEFKAEAEKLAADRAAAYLTSSNKRIHQNRCCCAWRPYK